jgi:hypothetical protein
LTIRVHSRRWNINPIDLDSFIAFCKTIVGQELDMVGGKSKFILSNITDHAFYYLVSNDKMRKQNIRYVKRVLDQYAKIQSLNPGHYAHITQNGSYNLALIQLYKNYKNNQNPNNTDRQES